jgi:hypothetical protein
MINVFITEFRVGEVLAKAYTFDALSFEKNSFSRVLA